jgi:hypothetical protein
MCGVESAAALAALPPGDSVILQGRPNHFLISGDNFINMDGRRTFPAAELAFHIISSMLRFPEENDENREEEDQNDDDGLDQEKDQIKESRGHHEALLAYLWTIYKSIAPSIRLADPPEDPTLGGRIQEIRSKLLTSTSAGHDTPRDRPEPMRENTRDLDTLAVATQGLISTLANIDKDRQEHRKEDQAEKSVLRNLGPPQLDLFKRLCTTKYNFPGEYTQTMQPNHAALHPREVPHQGGEPDDSENPRIAGNLLKVSLLAFRHRWSRVYGEKRLSARRIHALHVLPKGRG